MPDLKITKTTRGAIRLFHNKYHFRKDHNLLTGGLSWRCVVKNCKAPTKTDKDISKITRDSGDHSHSPLKVSNGRDTV